MTRTLKYEYLEKLDRRLLYYYDFCLYPNSGDPNEPRTDNFLGDITDELAMGVIVSSRHSYLTDRNFTRTPDGCQHKICKIKDIKLNFQNSRLLNFISIHRLLLNKEREENNEKRAAIKLKFKQFDAPYFMRW